MICFYKIYVQVYAYEFVFIYIFIYGAQLREQANTSTTIPSKKRFGPSTPSPRGNSIAATAFGPVSLASDLLSVGGRMGFVL
jgi:hypothetical protein